MIGQDGTIGTWSPSMVDVLSEDWAEVPEVPESSEAVAGGEKPEPKVGDVCTTNDSRPGTLQPNGEGQPLVCVADSQ